jgi:cell division protein ZapA
MNDTLSNNITVDKPTSHSVVNTSIEILGKFYSVRCPETELLSLQEAAKFLNQQMAEVQESGKAINLERIAIISALNIAHQFLQADQQKNGFINKVNQRIAQLQTKLDSALNRPLASELLYTTE